MQRHRTIIVATSLALAACSNKFQADLAACIAAAHDPSTVIKEEVPDYVRECMATKGWPVRDSCVGKPQLWLSGDCYMGQAAAVGTLFAV